MMPSSPSLDPVADASSTSRRLARASIAAPFTAVLVRVVASYLEETRQLDLDALSSNLATLITIAGIASGVAAVVGGMRRRSRDTITIAALGLFIGGVWVLLIVWGIVFVNTNAHQLGDANVTNSHTNSKKPRLHQSTNERILSYMERKNPPVDPASINAFEQRMGKKLPVEFKRFLELSNGGRFWANAWDPLPTVTFDGNDGQRRVGVKAVVGLLDHASADNEKILEGASETIHQKLYFFDDRLIPNMIPVASANGTVFTVSVDESDYGCVYYWDRNDFEFDLKYYLLVAKNFDEFLSGMEPAEAE